MVLHGCNYEPFELPSHDIVITLVYNVLLDIVFNAALVVFITLTTPLIGSVAQVLVIPVSMVSDYVLRGYVMPPMGFVGVSLICVGFIGLTVAGN